MENSQARSGTVLIVAAGLSALLIAMFGAFLLRMRADAAEMRHVLDLAQSRIMFHAALMYLQESSRIGWGDGTGECFGWTDVRDGSLGPRGPRPASGGTIPAPAWWTAHGDWPAYTPTPNESNPTSFPTLAQRRGAWPLPGTAVRCPMAVPVRPPYAIKPTFASNPVPTPYPYLGTGWSDTAWNTGATNLWPKSRLDAIFGANGLGMLDPQPVADNWSLFALPAGYDELGSGEWTAKISPNAGALVSGTCNVSVQAGTENQSWFRIYRELNSDHDGDGKPWYDYVTLHDPSNPAFNNWNAFIIACGSGPTHGFRFWNEDAITAWESANGLPSGTGRTLEPITAEESGLFPAFDRISFESILRTSSLMWWRVEWSGCIGGGFDGSVYNFNNYDLMYAIPEEAVNTYASYSPGIRHTNSRTFGGNFKWIQRLDHDPIKW